MSPEVCGDGEDGGEGGHGAVGERQRVRRGVPGPGPRYLYTEQRNFLWIDLLICFKLTFQGARLVCRRLKYGKTLFVYNLHLH